ncbi:MAG: heavy metal translocating P-type ATPase metal-binding domain-containing protein, partial [Steroidobacteraceae bacterium]
MAASPTDCFHCGEALAGRAPVWVRIGGLDQAVCCPGCRAAAQLIANLGLDDFYKFRTAPPVTPAPSAQDWSCYDVLTDTLTRAEPGGRGVMLALDGMTCAACSWLITRSLQQMDGVAQASVNTATGRAHIVWDEARVRLSQVLRR